MIPTGEYKSNSPKGIRGTNLIEKIVNTFTTLNDYSNHIYGAASVLSLFLSFIFGIITFIHKDLAFKEILYGMILYNIVNSFMLLYYSVKYSKSHQLSSELFRYKIGNRNLEILLQLLSETTHNITHYYRSLTFEFDEVISKINGNEELDKSFVEGVCERNSQFLVILTSSLQNYFSIHTDSNCSITIKLLSRDNDKICTLFRDPVNLKKRRQSEKDNNLQYFSPNDNTAYEIILDPSVKESFFVCDNLVELNAQTKYRNKNRDWANYYNATLVVPISKNNHTSKQRHVVGFISVDNMVGYLQDNTCIELMWGVSDLLYNYVLKYETISNYTRINNIKNEKQNEFNIRL